MCWKPKNLNKTALGFWIAEVDLLKVHEEGLGWTLWGQEKLERPQSHPEPHTGFEQCFQNTGTAATRCD